MAIKDEELLPGVLHDVLAEELDEKRDIYRRPLIVLGWYG